MKATVRDIEILQSIRPLELAAYLRVNGWKEQSQIPMASIWVKDLGQETFEILLPLTHDIADYATRMSEVFQTLEKVEQRSQLQILTDLFNSGADVVRVRTNLHDNASGSVPFEAGVILFQRARDMMLAAACAAVRPKAFFSTRKPDQAVDYLHKVRMGQTERGSYIITILSPVAPALTQVESGQLFPNLEDPFEREVVTTLAGALDATRIAAERSASSGTIEPFEQAIEKGVSANLCDAIVNMSESGGDTGVEVSFSWSRTREAPIEMPRRLLLPQDAMPFIKEAGRVFREKSPREDFKVQGIVYKLERAEGAPSGKVGVLAFIDAEPRKISIELPNIEYEKAIVAHQQGMPVICFGELSKEGHSFLLRNPRNFSYQADE